MKCDHCDHPAVVHEVVVKDGIKKEVHLCETHAKEFGYAIPDSTMSVHKHFVMSPPALSASPPATPQKQKKMSCETCGFTFSQFKKSGVLGCPMCYEAFARPLEALVERAQNGATHHVGKVPTRAGGSIDRQARISRLLRELEEAVSAEHYERAAQLRDALSDVEQTKLDGPAADQ